jgi:hypothetical protein
VKAFSGLSEITPIDQDARFVMSKPSLKGVPGLFGESADPLAQLKAIHMHGRHEPEVRVPNAVVLA